MKTIREHEQEVLEAVKHLIEGTPYEEEERKFTSWVRRMETIKLKGLEWLDAVDKEKEKFTSSLEDVCEKFLFRTKTEGRMGGPK